MPFDLALKAAYQGQGETLMDISQDKWTEQDSYHIFDLALTMEADSGSWDATVFVKNIGDESYASAIFSNLPQFNEGGYSQMLPKYSRRTVGAELRYFWF